MEPKLFHFPPDPIPFLVVSWDELQTATFSVAQQIKTSGTQIDVLVTLAKGGWPMARALVDFLGVSEVASLGVRFYKGVDDRLAKPVIYQDLPDTLAGKRVLLFDDVADTGESLLFALDYLSAHGIQKITTATPFYKPRSRFKPDHFAWQTDAWVIFPYEIMESMHVLQTRWAKQGVEQSEIFSRFTTLGFIPEHVAAFETALS